MAEKYYISYTKIGERCKEIADSLQDKGIERIVAITRGGMVPACILANLLEIKEIHSLSLSSYSENNERGEIRVLTFPSVTDSDRTLFVDDLIDSGSSYKWVKQRFPKSLFVALFSKTSTPKDIKLDCKTEVMKENLWLEFPWELESVYKQNKDKLRNEIVIEQHFEEPEIKEIKPDNEGINLPDNFLELVQEIPQENVENSPDKTVEEVKEENNSEVVKEAVQPENNEDKTEESANIKLDEEKEIKEKVFNPKEEYEQDGYFLSKEQKAVINYIINKRSQLTVLTGKAGTGKSSIIKFLRNWNRKWPILATTGKAALLIGARTVDAFFSYSREKNIVMNFNALTANMAAAGNLIIIDEASMMGKAMFEKIYSMCVRFNKDVLLVGDWGQAAPVKDDWIFDSKEFIEDVSLIKLKECHRQSQSNFLEVLDKIRTGNVDEQVNELMRSRICRRTPDKDSGYVILFPFNKQVKAYNEKAVNEKSEELGEPTFRMDSIVDAKIKMSEEKKLSLIENANLAHNELLCKGCRILITRNNLPAGYCNGDTGTLKESSGSIWSVILDRNGKEVKVERAVVEQRNAKDELEANIIGYPFKAGYALSVHKSQGATLPKVWADLEGLNSMHMHGIAYVALSRVRNLEDLLISSWNPGMVVVDPIVQEYL